MLFFLLPMSLIQTKILLSIAFVSLSPPKQPAKSEDIITSIKNSAFFFIESPQVKPIRPSLYSTTFESCVMVNRM